MNFIIMYLLYIIYTDLRKKKEMRKEARKEKHITNDSNINENVNENSDSINISSKKGKSNNKTVTSTILTTFDTDELGLNKTKKKMKKRKVTHSTCDVCNHEVGGLDAVYVEEVRNDNNYNSSFGPSYRVISCSCHKKIKRLSDWCEYCSCMCTRCNGNRDIIKLSHHDYFGNNYDNDNYSMGKLLTKEVLYSLLLILSIGILYISYYASYRAKYGITIMALICCFWHLENKK